MHNRLPESVQTILKTLPELSLEQISDLAHKIVEISPLPAVHAVTNTSGQVDTSNNNDILGVIKQLSFEVNELRSRHNQKPQWPCSRILQKSSIRPIVDLLILPRGYVDTTPVLVTKPANAFLPAVSSGDRLSLFNQPLNRHGSSYQTSISGGHRLRFVLFFKTAIARSSSWYGFLNQRGKQQSDEDLRFPWN